MTFTKNTGDLLESMGGYFNANIPNTTYQDYTYSTPEGTALGFRVYQIGKAMVAGLNLILIAMAIWFGTKMFNATTKL
jgi:hypothetical protein